MADNKVLFEYKALSLCIVTLEDGSIRYKVSDDKYGHRSALFNRVYDPGINKDFYSLRNALNFFNRLVIANK